MHQPADRAPRGACGRHGAAHLCGVGHVYWFVADFGAGHFDAANRRANLALRQDGAHLPADGAQIRLAGGLSDQGALQRRLVVDPMARGRLVFERRTAHQHDAARAGLRERQPAGGGDATGAARDNPRPLGQRTHHAPDRLFHAGADRALAPQPHFALDAAVRKLRGRGRERFHAVSHGDALPLGGPLERSGLDEAGHTRRVHAVAEHAQHHAWWRGSRSKGGEMREGGANGIGAEAIREDDEIGVSRIGRRQRHAVTRERADEGGRLVRSRAGHAHRPARAEGRESRAWGGERQPLDNPALDGRDGR